MISQDALSQAISAVGGQKALGDAIGVRQSLVWYWLRRSRKGVPAEYARKIQDITGVPASRLRPDVFPSRDLGEAA
ncbi:MAG: helix-turn-helix domain-containing protein [Cryobacterium sp.]|nr:helix-turn-helix domain-containing protein [Cryobacterium sp.]